MIAVAVAIGLMVLGFAWLIRHSSGLTVKPCARCHVEGGERWIRERKVGNRLVREQVCGECSSAIFFGRRGVDWEPLPREADDE